MQKLILFFILYTISFAQNDYPTTNNLFGSELEHELHKLTRRHIRFSYTSSSTDVWNILRVSDADTTNSNNVILIYTQYIKDGPSEYDGGSGWNREHVWPNSHGFPNVGDTAYTDIHQLKPADISTNSARGNKDFDNGGNIYYDGGTYQTDCRADTDSWEVGDTRKGDIGRIVLYSATRYSSQTLDLELVDYTDTPNEPMLGKLSTMLQWNASEPPNAFERHRNDVIQSYQHNRNPFIDHPEFANRIYKPNDFIIEYAQAIAPAKFIVKFTREINATSAQNIANYKLMKSLNTIVSASVGYNGDNHFVQITMDENYPEGSYYYIKVSNLLATNGETIDVNSISRIYVNPAVGIHNDNIEPNEYKLFQNYPNPFNPTTVISYKIMEESRVELNIYNILGKKVKSLVNEIQPSGVYNVNYDASDLVSGVYFYSISAGDFHNTKKMVLLK